MRVRLGRFGWLLFLVPLLALLAPGTARAQQWLADRKAAQGAGVRVGDFELHPGIGAEFGYDSNVFNASGQAVGPGGPIPIHGAPILRITPHLFFSTLSGARAAVGGNTPPALAFSGGLQASYYHWFADYPGQLDNLEGDLLLHLDINPSRPFAVQLDERFTRTVRPYADNFGAVAPNYGRNTNVVGATAIFSTSGGVLSGRLGYNFAYDFFDSSGFNAANNFDHNIVLGATYRFLPRTAIVYDLNLDYLTYQGGGGMASTLLVPGFRVATRVGLNGVITTRLSASAMIGYGAGFFSDVRVADYESLIAQLELRWQISEAARLALGYDRAFFPSFVGQFVRRDRGYLNFQLLLSGQFLLGAEVAVGLFDFGTPLNFAGAPLGSTPGGNTARSDVMLIGSLFAEYRFTAWLGLNATVRYTGDFTDWQYMGVGGSAASLAPAKYNKVEAFLGLRVFL